ncbi:glycosyltransferase [Micromonospora sp. NPDC004704]
MRVLIVTAGSRGDVAPYTGLGARLQAAGHRVTVAAQPSFAALVTGCGLDFAPLPGDLAALRAAGGRRRHRFGAEARSLAGFVRLGTRFVDELGDGIQVAAEPGVDLLLCSTTTAPLGYSVAERHGVPSMGAFLQPLQPTREFPPMVLGARSLGGWGNRNAARLAQVIARRVYANASRRLRTRLGLPPTRLHTLLEAATARGWPIQHGFSPSVLPRPADWRPGLEVVGYWWPAESPGWRPPPILVDFLDAGPPPVYVGFGSMVGGDERFRTLITAALRRAGVRGVIQVDGGAQPVRAVTDDVITIGEAPHPWLFPRMAALVHHAGCGTTAAGLRAGVPAIPIPMMADQPFWAARLAVLGVSPDTVPAGRLDQARLATAIRAAVTDPAFADRARVVAARLAAEDGAGAVVRAVDRLAG